MRHAITHPTPTKMLLTQSTLYTQDGGSTMITGETKRAVNNLMIDIQTGIL